MFVVRPLLLIVLAVSLTGPAADAEIFDHLVRECDPEHI